jgi:hypothetical protein
LKNLLEPNKKIVNREPDFVLQTVEMPVQRVRNAQLLESITKGVPDTASRVISLANSSKTAIRQR